MTIPQASTSTPRTPARTESLSRARSVRTERRRDKFAKVLRGRSEDGSAVELGGSLKSLVHFPKANKTQASSVDWRGQVYRAKSDR